MELFGGDGGGGAQGAVMVASAAVVANPVNSDSGSDGEPVVDEANSDAVLAPDLLLIRLYGRTLMQLGPLMPVLFVFFGMMNAYNRNKEFMAWEQEARCTADNTLPFDACRDDYCTKQPATMMVLGNTARRNCAPSAWALSISTRQSSVLSTLSSLHLGPKASHVPQATVNGAFLRARSIRRSWSHSTYCTEG